MKPKMVFLLSIFLSLSISCSKADLGDPINYELILENHLSYDSEETIPEQTLVFKNESDLNNFLPVIEQVNPYRVDNLKNLDFDFSHNDLILIIGKYYAYCCSKININGVYKENNSVVVKYKESGPGEATAVSQAYTVLKISKEDSE
ncbi:hypothetical protein FHG64_18080 [Antarcticibacterium flavum]|uniref:Lipoprotein n=1 Tax=Antarcticibacterium flavum TaxID=2058175 RepID=A0A5B7X8T9_9FLAO|nr:MULTISPECIES: protease complex subunit PrcB family protein [Antarcticibacterium]MCM4161773.1 hypothetical protein [Antarcticibacterium sp. W02-3]QCY71148.1 hypothetical protein FHG64_18080 [Antarcticibacterium flavum]